MQHRRGFAAAVMAAATVAALAGVAGVQPGPARDSADLAAFTARANDVLGLEASHLEPLDIHGAIGGPVTTRVTVNDRRLTLDLAPHSVRAPDFEVRAQRGDGRWEIHDPGPVKTLRGHVREIPGSIVAGALLDDGLTVTIVTPDGARHWVEPAAGHVPGAEHLHVVYAQDDVLAHGGSCGSEAVERESHDTPGADDLDGVAGTAFICTAELATDADVEYFNLHGSVQAVQDRIALVVNTMNVQYENEVSITHQLTTMLVRTAEPDPYSSDTSFGLLCEFVNEWTNNQPAIDRDIAHLFTARNTGGIIGQAAEIGSTCEPDGCTTEPCDCDPMWGTKGSYCFAQSDFNGNFACATDLSAHELGHLWNAVHCGCVSPPFTMNGFIVCANTFSTESRDRIGDWRDASPCLECVITGTTLPFFDDFPGISFDPSLWFTIDGVEINDEGVDEPSSPFSMNVDGQSEVITTRINTSGLSDLTVSYFWQRTGGGDQPAPGEDLIVEYEAPGSDWVEVARHAGDGPAMTEFVFESIIMPAGASHQDFRLRFRHGGVEADAGDFFVDDVAIDGLVAPANDDCLAAPLALAGLPTPFTTLGATTDGPSEAVACGFEVSNDVWYRHFAGCDGTLTVEISGSDYDHTVAVYADIGCPAGANEAVACLEAPATSLTVAVAAGTALHIRIGGTGASEGDATMTLGCEDDPVGCIEDCGGDDDGQVTVVDLLALLGQWESPDGTCDFDGGGVDVVDLLRLLGAWGSCP